jgi:hypothetical protein
MAPALALAAVGTSRLATGSATRDPFQRPQIARSRAAIETLVPAAAVVLTTPALGRPAENIAYYTHAEAEYVGDLGALGSTVDLAVRRAQEAGRRTFLLLPAFEPPPIVDPALRARVREVARARGDALRDWFADPGRADAGAALFEIEPAYRGVSNVVKPR